jgi:hypothetical protein
MPTHELTNKEYMLVFFDGSKKIISQKQYLNIFSNMGKHESFNIKIDDQLYNSKSISKLLSLEEYYNQHPQDRPPVYKALEIPPISKTTNKRHTEEMIKGLKKYITSDKYRGTDKPIELLKQMEQRLLTVK